MAKEEKVALGPGAEHLKDVDEGPVKAPEPPVVDEEKPDSHKKDTRHDEHKES